MQIKSLSKLFNFFAISAIALLGLSSCKSTNNATTSVQLFNASPDAGSVNLFLSGSKKTATPVAYGNSSNYVLAVAGNQTAEVKSSGSGILLSSIPVSIGANSYFSVFVCGQASTNNINAFIAQDNLNIPSPSKAKIRFVNAVAAAPKASLLLNSNVFFSGKAYKSVSDYAEVAAGTYSIRLITSDTAATALTTAFDQTFVNGKIYTIIFKGEVGATTDALRLNLSVLANN